MDRLLRANPSPLRHHQSPALGDALVKGAEANLTIKRGKRGSWSQAPSTVSLGERTSWLFLWGIYPENMDPTCPPTVRVSCRSSVLGPKFNVLVLVWPSCRAHQSKGTWDQCDFSQSPPVCEPYIFVAKEGSPQLHSRDQSEPTGAT